MSFTFDSLNALGNQITVAVPKDEDGFLGRECPEDDCKKYFKIKPGTGLTGDGLPCHCPYCGYTGSTNRFWTPEQIEYAESIAFREVYGAVGRDLKQLEFEHKPKPGGFGIGISLKVKPGTPPPIQYYREKALETHVTCNECTLQYAVYGVFGFCPDCGVHNSLQILQRNLEIARRLLALAESQADTEIRRELIEAALKSCVSAFDSFAQARVSTFCAKAHRPEKVSSIRFQNMRAFAAGMKAHFDIDVQRETPADDWMFVHQCFMRRHLLTHTSGVIDQKYRDETGEGRHLLGRRVAVSAADVERLATIVEALGVRLAATLEALP